MSDRSESGGGQIDRREFTLQFALGVLSAATITVVPACGGGGGGGNPGGPSPNPGGGGGNGAVGSVSANHGHVATISGAELTAGNEVTLDIRGNADHPHTVVVTAAQVMQIAAQQRVTVESSTEDAHSHLVIFN